MVIYEGSKQIAREYRKALIDAGKTQEDIGRELGVTRQTVNSIFRKKHISFDDLERLLKPIGYKVAFEFIKDE